MDCFMNDDSSIFMRIRARLFDIAWFLLIASQLISVCTWYATEQSGIKVMLYKGVTAASCLLCAAVIVMGLVKRHYPVKPIILYGILCIIFALSWYESRINILIWLMLILIAAFGQESRRAVFIAAVTASAVLLFNILACETGIIDNYIFDAGGERPRSSMGFVWTSVAPTILFFIALEYIYLSKSSMKIWEYLMIEAVNVYLFLKTDTNLPFLFISAFLVFFAVEGFFKNRFGFLKHLKWLYYLSPLIICGISIAATLLPDTSSELWIKLNTLLNNRPALARAGFDTFALTPFGQQIEWHGGSITAGVDEIYNYVDCSYIKVLFDYGIVFLAAILCIYTFLIVRAAREGDYWLLLACIIILIHSLTEPRIVDITFNIFPVMAFMRLGGEPLKYTKGFIKDLS